MKPIYTIFALCLALTGCEKPVGQVKLGPVVDAEVSFFSVDDQSTPVFTTMTNTLDSLNEADQAELTDAEKLAKVGQIQLGDFQFEEDQFYLVETFGGQDVDVEDDEIIDDVATPVVGQLHGLIDGATINGGDYKVSLLTETAFQIIGLSDDYALENLLNDLNTIASTLVSRDLNGDALVNYADLLVWDPVEHGDALFASRDAYQNLLEALHRGDDVYELALAMQRTPDQPDENEKYNVGSYLTDAVSSVTKHGLWIVVGSESYVSTSPDTGTVEGTRQRRFSLRIKESDQPLSDQIQFCSVDGWLDISHTGPFTAIMDFSPITNTEMDVTWSDYYAEDGYIDQIEGAYKAVKISDDSEASLGQITQSVSIIDYDSPDLSLIRLFDNETHFIDCFSESDDPRFIPETSVTNTHVLEYGLGNVDFSLVTMDTSENTVGYIANIEKGDQFFAGIGGAPEFSVDSVPDSVSARSFIFDATNHLQETANSEINFVLPGL